MFSPEFWIQGFYHLSDNHSLVSVTVLGPTPFLSSLFNLNTNIRGQIRGKISQNPCLGGAFCIMNKICLGVYLRTFVHAYLSVLPPMIQTRICASLIFHENGNGLLRACLAKGVFFRTTVKLCITLGLLRCRFKLKSLYLGYFSI